MREVFLVQIKGTKPYLMHAFKGESGTKSRRRGAHPTVEQDCEDALYRDSEKRIYVPSLHVWASIRDASKNFKWKGRLSYWQVVNSSVFVEPNELVITPQEYVQFVTGVVINRQRIMKGRPQFNDWTLSFDLVNTEEALSETALKDIVQEAGQRHGIGDWRPRFGTYEIAEWKRKPPGVTVKG